MDFLKNQLKNPAVQQGIQQGIQQVQQHVDSKTLNNIFNGVQTIANVAGQNKRYRVKINTNTSASEFTRSIHEQIKKQGLWNQDTEKFYNDRDGPNFTLSNCSGGKKALFIGINYFGTQAELKGCINDVKNVSALVCQRFGFNNCTYLTDDQQDASKKPTYDNIINGMRWLVEGAQPGDSLFFHYSGHGGTAKDSETDEIDGFDETILPLDYSSKGQIVDDVIYENLVKPLPKGCRLTAVFDSCHSGTVMDLPYTYQCDGKVEVIENDVRKEIFKKAISVVGSLITGDTGAIAKALMSIFDGSLTSTSSNTNQQAVIEKRKHDADVIQFSGCRDNQTSADASINNVATGAMSYALITVLNQNQNISYSQLLTQIRKIMTEKRFSQIPQLSSSHPMDMNSQFTM
jgi:Caspase domain.